MTPLRITLAALTLSGLAACATPPAGSEVPRVLVDEARRCAGWLAEAGEAASGVAAREACGALTLGVIEGADG